jgi:hypothetical protein
MIQSFQSEYEQGGTKASPTSTVRHAARQAHTSRAHRSYVNAGWSPISFAEPEINSLWDTGLLDRLSLPLTRYHE